MVDSKNKVCPKCKTELTDEETALKARTCWFCVTGNLKMLGETDHIPAPETFGRPAGWDELAKRENLKALAAISQTSAPASADQQASDIPPHEQNELRVEYGINAGVKIPTTVITVKGKNDETYMQFSVRGQVPNETKKQFEAWMTKWLEMFGTMLAFGPSFGGIAAGAKLLSMDQFFNNK